MHIARIRVQHVRNHTELACEFGEHATLICGKNGAGKTSVLEAIYVAYRGTSFKGSDRDILATAHAWYRIDLQDDTKYSRRVIFDNRTERPIKEFTIDDKKYARLPLRYKRPIVLFTPNDLRLVDGSPTRRREYIDTVLGQINPEYSTILRRYERTIQQRNKLMKSIHGHRDQFFSWNIILSEAGAYIINKRYEFIERLNQSLNDYYRAIAQTADTVTVEYTHQPTTPAKLLAQYEQSFDRDRLLGSTSVGPHRHDLRITLRQSPACDTASRGEMRTIIIALKYIEAEMLKETFDEYPLILLDDVYSELDMDRRRNLVHTLHDYQIIITSTDKVTGLPHGTKRIEL